MLAQLVREFIRGRCIVHGMPGGVACETHVLARGMVQWVVKFDTE